MKSNIVTLTLSPAIDKSTTVDFILPEHKMRCAVPKYEAGGGGINVSRGLKRLGLHAKTVFPAGGMPGQLLQELLEKEGIEQYSVPTKNWTRENFIVVSTTNNQQYRFGMPGNEIYEDEEKLIYQKIEELASGAEYIVASGSLPPGIHKDFLARIARLTKRLGSRLVVDTSGEALKHAADEGIFLLKPNLAELSMLSGISELDDESVIDAAKKLISDKPCEVIVVSMGPNGACLVTKDFSELVPAPTVKKKSTVGAGDSMVAGMVYALSTGKNLRETVRMGIACGTAATMNHGTELFNKDDALKLYDGLLKR
ncbi:hexose kinase [Pedobacter sp. HMF7647]|uniref:Hexose kinase n=1 Tax=Hufsiella arboris TaxID=2695275 RepID=A0A7K1Y9Y3_9SPHI|nr:1-phosphofructokinase family hexose kinase [Hufsiella arboris]MXV51397.1 hexose kinase [Hufsiella arboris]